jgi:hypothetical protein
MYEWTAPALPRLLLIWLKVGCKQTLPAVTGRPPNFYSILSAVKWVKSEAEEFGLPAAALASSFWVGGCRRCQLFLSHLLPPRHILQLAQRQTHLRAQGRTGQQPLAPLAAAATSCWLLLQLLKTGCGS